MKKLLLLILATTALALSASSAMPSSAHADEVFRKTTTGKTSQADVDGDRVLRNNAQVTIFPSLLRAVATYNSSDITNYSYKCARIYLDITAEGGTSLLDLKLQSKDPVSGAYFDIPGAALDQKSATSGDDTLTVCPGVAETANETVSDVMPFTWRVVTVVGGTSFTFSVGGDLYK